MECETFTRLFQSHLPAMYSILRQNVLDHVAFHIG